MKQIVLDFFRRGFAACWIGPMVLVVLYLALHRQTGIETLTVNEVCLGIVSLSALAFVAGGMNVLYQMERLPLMAAILIHGGVLYLSYLAVYLLNDWLEQGMTPILIFSVIFVLGYLAIWAVIYSITKKDTAKLNEQLQQRQQQERA
ncbi:MAG: DUF3021 domain-containing protein [Ruminiclostridium sp.]|nr:DUF3021 domain-containing protein [Ruminiclostridium sp.]